MKSGDAKLQAYRDNPDGGWVTEIVFLILQGYRNGIFRSRFFLFYTDSSTFTQKGSIAMQASYINPFLTSSVVVIEQLIQIRPSVGKIQMKDLVYDGDHIFLKIGIIGQMQGDVVFIFPRLVALRLVSGMMGGFTVTELDALGQSAISELGNMISGNASTIMYNEGIEVDITTPLLIIASEKMANVTQTITIPMIVDSIGEFQISIALKHKQPA